MKKILPQLELLSPAGNMEKLEAALYFGADAVYVGGQNFSLRNFSQNFSNEEINFVTKTVHSLGKKLYVTVNIFARDSDFEAMKLYLQMLAKANVDAVIVSDLGVLDMVLTDFPSLNVHISTQANTTNARSVNFLAKLGAKRVILARELSLTEIKEIKDNLKYPVELEAFVHGAMCISYSGRCLLSNYFTDRLSNRGECVQPCRWDYTLTQKAHPKNQLTVNEDNHGTYILNSKDLNMIEYLDKMADAGISAFKIEGRMKTSYYVAAVTNAYRRAMDLLRRNLDEYVCPQELKDELYKTSHRGFSKGFYFGTPEQSYNSSRSVYDYDMIAKVLASDLGKILVEQRNKFCVGDEIEVLSPTNNYNITFKVQKIEDEKGKEITVADKVQQAVYIFTNLPLQKGDFLRKKLTDISKNI